MGYIYLFTKVISPPAPAQSLRFRGLTYIGSGILRRLSGASALSNKLPKGRNI